MNGSPKKVLVAMSGGVDSSVAAALLLEQGYDVFGATLALRESVGDAARTGYGRTCCSLDDVEDARNTAFRLGIPFYVMNMKDLFMERVVTYFVGAYCDGITPNPCIACNRYVKFEAMFRKAMTLGMDYVATGHYARVAFDGRSKRYVLKKAVDCRKDQSYVLYMLNQDQLGRILFPLGDLSKTEVRSIARAKGLPASDKPDSQDICFVDDGGYAGFIGKHGKDGKHGNDACKPGNFINSKGEILGRHRGIINYTIGQRKGLGIAGGKPLYVIGKDACGNTVTLGGTQERYKKAFLVSGMNYTAFATPPPKFRASAKIRYSAHENDATVTPLDEGSARIEFDEPQADITPGQASVLYDGDIVLGGGIIESVLT